MKLVKKSCFLPSNINYNIAKDDDIISASYYPDVSGISGIDSFTVYLEIRSSKELNIQGSLNILHSDKILDLRVIESHRGLTNNGMLNLLTCRPLY